MPLKKSDQHPDWILKYCSGKYLIKLIQIIFSEEDYNECIFSQIRCRREKAICR